MLFSLIGSKKIRQKSNLELSNTSDVQELIIRSLVKARGKFPSAKLGIEPSSAKAQLSCLVGLGWPEI